MPASGTAKARLMPGFSRGSARSASAIESSLTGRSVSRQPCDELLGVLLVVLGGHDEHAAGVLEARPGAMRRTTSFSSTHSTAASRSLTT